MEKRPDLKLHQILVEVKQHFSFLFRRGFRVEAAMFVDEASEAWQVILFSSEYTIKIYGDDQQLNLGINLLAFYEAVGLFELQEVLAWVGVHQPASNRPSDFQQIAQLLENNLELILSQFQKAKRLIPQQNGRLHLNSRPFIASEINSRT